MAKLKLGFLPRRRYLLGSVLLGITTIGCAHALLVRQELVSRIEEETVRLSQVQRLATREAGRHASLARQDPQQLAEAVKLGNDLQRPWEKMLDALQRSARPDMQIIRLQAEPDAYRLIIAGQADSSTAFLAYVERLRKDPAWNRVEPISEENSTQAATSVMGKPVSFQLMADWRLK